MSDIVDRLRALANELFDDPDVGAAVAEIERLRSEAADIARWIVEQWGYPIEVGTEKPPPEPWRRRIEDAWIDRQQPMDPGNDEDIRLSVGIEGGWVG